MTRRPLATVASIVAIALVCAGMLCLPGRTVTAAFINDVLIFLDGAQRIAVGQVPNRDFHTALGPLVFYIPAAGYLLSGNFGAAMPTGMAVLLVAFIPAMVRILPSRLSPPLAIGLAAFLVLLLAAPINLGSAIWQLSFAMFYNRIGWAALGLLLVMYLVPANQTGKADLADGLAAAFLLLVQFYAKATYGLVGLAFVVFMLSDRRQRPWAMVALLLTALAMLAIELFWRGTWDYIEDLRAAAKVSGGLNVLSLIGNFLNNLADLTVFGIIAVIAFWRTRSIRDLLFYGFCVLAGLLIINQNAHGWGIITLYCGAAVAVARATRPLENEGPDINSKHLVTGLPLLLIFFLLPPVAHHGAALVLHTALAAGNAGEPIGLPLFRNVRNLQSPAERIGFMGRYVDSITSGGQLLQALPNPPERVFVLDFANPFSAGLGIRPPAGDSAWLHWGRNINEKSYLPAEALFADVEIVMIPKIGINSLPLQQLYGSFISREFELWRETSEWKVYRRHRPEAKTG